MKAQHFIFFLLLFSKNASSQKLYGIVNLTAPFSGISYTNGHNKAEFTPSIPDFNGSWRFDILLRSKQLSHKISFEELPFQMYFKVTNRFWNTPGDSLTRLGVRWVKYGNTIDVYVVSYMLQKENKNPQKFLFRNKMKFNYAGGLGFTPNRSKYYYRERFTYVQDGSSGSGSYNAYEATVHRDGFGLFLKVAGGIDFFNRKNKRWLCLNAFYNQGLKDMAHFDIHYVFGYFHDTNKQVDVPKQVLRSRGTTFGFSLGVPIKIVR